MQSTPLFSFLQTSHCIHTHTHTHTQGFKQDDAVYASLPGFAKLLNRSFKLQGQLAAPIPYPAMIKVWTCECMCVFVLRVCACKLVAHLLPCHLSVLIRCFIKGLGYFGNYVLESNQNLQALGTYEIDQYIRVMREMARTVYIRRIKSYIDEIPVNYTVHTLDIYVSGQTKLWAA